MAGPALHTFNVHCLGSPTLAAAETHAELPEDPASLGLAALAESRLSIEVFSEVLGETILLVGNGVEYPADEQRVVYRSDELEMLLELDRPQVVRLHQLKKLFRGTLFAGSAFGETVTVQG